MIIIFQLFATYFFYKERKGINSEIIYYYYKEAEKLWPLVILRR